MYGACSWTYNDCYVFHLEHLINTIRQWLNYLFIFLFYRHVAIKEIILDPNKKTRTKDAVLKEARYILDYMWCTMYYLYFTIDKFVY